MQASLKLSAIGVLGTLCILLGGLVFKIDIIILLLLSIIYLGIVAHFCGMNMSDIVDGMKQGCTQAFEGLLFFLLIGAIIGVWIQAGTVPTLVYYGMNILNPQYILISSFVICGLVSCIIGTSWGTVGTVGIAIMGVAVASGLNIPLYVIAGSIVSGSWFGDKMSPISDTTVLTATACGTDVYRHIKTMAFTTLPSYGIALVIFFMLNKKYVSTAALDMEAVQPMKDALHEMFHLGIPSLIPVVILVILCVLKVNAVLSLLVVIGSGVLVSIFVQGNSVEMAMNAIMNGMSVESDIPAVELLLNRGGVNSMLSTFLLGFMALCLGGVLQKTGFLSVILEKITTKLHSTLSLVFTTMVTCIMSNAVFGDIYLGIVLNGNMYKEVYKEKGLDPSMLSRTIEEAVTMSAPIIPWTAASAFVVGALGVPTIQYLPYAVLNLVNPIVSLLFAAFGIGVIRMSKTAKEKKEA